MSCAVCDPSADVRFNTTEVPLIVPDRFTELKQVEPVTVPVPDKAVVTDPVF